MNLNPDFALTPRNDRFFKSWDERAGMAIFGPTFGWIHPYYFDAQHQNDELLFAGVWAADPTAKYSAWSIRRSVPRIHLFFDLSSQGSDKELALVFVFKVLTRSRVLVFSDAGQVEDVTLKPGDKRFLVEVESIDAMNLYFIHAGYPPHNSGGDWLFRGITGYVI